MDKDYLICLIGKSGSGKTSIAEHYRSLGYNVIDSYTDRPKRNDKETGHIFISSDEVEKYRHEMIAYTFFDNHHYFATKSQYVNKGVTFYVIDPVGVIELEKTVKDIKAEFIYINVDESICRERMYKRYDISTNNADGNYQNLINSIEKRIEHDKKAFSVVRCTYVVDNNGNLRDTLQNLKNLLSEVL